MTMKARIALGLGMALLAVFIYGQKAKEKNGRAAVPGGHTVDSGFQPLARNPMHLAMLRWWLVIKSFPPVSTEAGPVGMAFDGENMWVANELGNSVTKIQASTGTVLGTFGSGHEAQFLAFDGLNAWITNGSDHMVSRL
jgi:hypothetical protein